MIRQDYLLRLIEQLQRVLASIAALKAERRWHEITGTLDEQFTQLLGVGVAELARLSDTELMARLVQGESTPFVREKTHVLTALFKEAGDSAAAQGHLEESRAFYLRGLHLLLGAEAGGPFECPDFLPGLEVFLSVLADAPLPTTTQARLMRHHEQRGAFAKAENALFDLLDAEPGNAHALDFGIAFYERLRNQTDLALESGGLPRDEVEAGLAELHRRKSSLP